MKPFGTVSIVIIASIILICAFIWIRNRYYLDHMRHKIFPYQMDDISLNEDLTTEPNYQKIIDVMPFKPTDKELRFILKYKRFVEADDIYSMTCDDKVNQMTKLIDVIEKEKISGSIVETGVWRGGMCMWIKCCLKYHRSKRDIWLFDTFEYFPEPKDEKDKVIHPITKILFENMPSVTDVKDNFRRFGLLDDRVNLVPGEFDKTILKTDTGDISILRLDSDYYDSTMYVLEQLYDKVVVNGFIVIDDYGNDYVACRRAVDDFRSKNGITDKICDGDHSESVYWRKTC